jgi:hypothetical protein
VSPLRSHPAPALLLTSPTCIVVLTALINSPQHTRVSRKILRYIMFDQLVTVSWCVYCAAFVQLCARYNTTASRLRRYYRRYKNTASPWTSDQDRTSSRDLCYSPLWHPTLAEEGVIVNKYKSGCARSCIYNFLSASPPPPHVSHLTLHLELTHHNHDRQRGLSKQRWVDWCLRTNMYLECLQIFTCDY